MAGCWGAIVPAGPHAVLHVAHHVVEVAARVHAGGCAAWADAGMEPSPGGDTEWPVDCCIASGWCCPREDVTHSCDIVGVRWNLKPWWAAALLLESRCKVLAQGSPQGHDGARDNARLEGPAGAQSSRVAVVGVAQEGGGWIGRSCAKGCGKGGCGGGCCKRCGCWGGCKRWCGCGCGC